MPDGSLPTATFCARSWAEAMRMLTACCGFTSRACGKSWNAIPRDHASSKPSQVWGTASMSTERRDGSGLEWREVHRGIRPGDQFVRIARHKAFRKLGTGRNEIRGGQRLNGLTGLYTRFKRLII